jgi:5-oxoprolinase (ATP-hydrolysing) subunit A
MQTIDINCDMGERTHLWPYHLEHDFALMPYTSSINIACGAHAGDTDTIKRLVEHSLRYDIAIGAHPSYEDRKNFGRIDVMNKAIHPEDLTDILKTQVDRVQKICLGLGTRVSHVKPHGALYNRAAWDREVSALICTAIHAVDSSLLFYGLSGSEMKTAAASGNVTFISEVFADRTYQEDGSLTPRTAGNALIEAEGQSLRQVLQMVQTGTVTSTSGKTIPVKAGTVCVHSDGAHALAFAKNMHTALIAQGISITSP